MHAQLTEVGFNFGYIASRYTLRENQINDQLFVSQGRLNSGATAGIQIMVGAPKDQNVPYVSWKHGVMLELNMSRAGGNIDAVLGDENSFRSFTTLQYTTYQGEAGVKYVAKINRFRIFAGPTFSNFLYRSVSTTATEETRSALNQFNDYYVSAELGIGVNINKFTLSSRYQMAVSEFGKETALIPTQYNYHGLKLIIAYFFLEKHKGKYWDSIYWE